MSVSWSHGCTSAAGMPVITPVAEPSRSARLARLVWEPCVSARRMAPDERSAALNDLPDAAGCQLAMRERNVPVSAKCFAWEGGSGGGADRGQRGFQGASESGGGGGQQGKERCSSAARVTAAGESVQVEAQSGQVIQALAAPRGLKTAQPARPCCVAALYRIRGTAPKRHTVSIPHPHTMVTISTPPKAPTPHAVHTRFTHGSHLLHVRR